MSEPGRRSLVLMGLRGSGKSTLGRAVAGATGLPFVDLDEVTTGLLGGGTLAEQWSRLGEGAFRDAEASALRAQLAGAAGSAFVLALGGGTPTAPGAAEMLGGAVGGGGVELVYLRGQPETLRERLCETDTGERPSLTGAGTLEEIGRVFDARDGLYSRLASRVIAIEGETVDALAARLADLIA